MVKRHPAAHTAGVEGGTPPQKTQLKEEPSPGGAAVQSSYTPMAG